MTNNQKPVFAQILANPRVEICAMNGERKWIRIAATAVVDPRREARAHMLEINPGLGRMYSADDGKMEVFYLQDADVTISSFTEPPVTLHF